MSLTVTSILYPAFPLSYGKKPAFLSSSLKKIIMQCPIAFHSRLTYLLQSTVVYYSYERLNSILEYTCQFADVLLHQAARRADRDWGEIWIKAENWSGTQGLG